MELDPAFTFIHLAESICSGINNAKTQEFFEKWGLKYNICTQQFSFNEPFQLYHKYHLAESFFKDENVIKKLKIKKGHDWIKQGFKAHSVEVKQLPCTVKNMSFFKKLQDPVNKIAFEDGYIRKRFDTDIDGFLVSDNLQGMLLDKECDEYNVYRPEEREEFIFRIFQMLVLGGQLCQYEDELQPYLDITKQIYKDLVKVQKQESNDLAITTTVLEVVAKNSDGISYYPINPSEKRNIAFLCINRQSRVITTFYHQYN